MQLQIIYVLKKIKSKAFSITQNIVLLGAAVPDRIPQLPDHKITAPLPASCSATHLEITCSTGEISG